MTHASGMSVEGIRIRLNVGGLPISVGSSSAFLLVGCPASFLTDAPVAATIDIQRRVALLRDSSAQPDKRSDEAVGAGWNSYHWREQDRIVVVSRQGAVETHLPADPVSGDIVVYVDPEYFRQDLNGDEPWGRGHAVEILPIPIVAMLSARRGLFMHSAGLVCGQGGAILSGVSGSGKSTLSSLWRQARVANSYIVDDEHIIVRDDGNGFKLYGAPWARGHRQSALGNVPVTRLFFLVHGHQNEVIPLSPSDALSRLMSQVFLPLWSAKQLEFVVETCVSFIQQVQCYQFSFLPKADTVLFLQQYIQGC